MKLWLVSFMIFAANPAWAFSTRWVCATEPLSTSYSLIEDETGFELQFLHHNGVAFMPVHDGLITAFDIAEIERKAKIFAKLGPRGSIVFEKSMCVAGGNEWTCTKPGVTRIGDVDAKDLQVTLRERRVITRKVDLKTFSIELSFVVGNEGLSVPMSYDASACAFHLPR